MAEEPTPAEVRWGGATLTFDRGRICGLRRDGLTVLTGFDVLVSEGEAAHGVNEAVPGVDDVVPGVNEAVHRVDEDEIESVWTIGPGQSLTVRHNFDRTWSVRVLVVNDAAVPLELARILIGAVPGPGFTGWSWESGALGRFALLGTEGGESLVFTVQRGSLRAWPGEHGISDVAGDLGPLQVAPHSRQVVSLRGVWLRPDQLSEDLPSWLPSLELGAGEPLQLRTPDLALSVPPGTAVAEADEMVEVLPKGGAGARQLVLTGAPGTIFLDAVWAPPLAEALSEAASSALDSARRRQGVACLDPASAVLLQRSSVRGQDVDDALNRALEMASSDDPWSIVLWASTCTRAARADYLQRAGEALIRLPARPGCGMAALHLVLAQLAAGVDPQIDPVLARLALDARDADDPATALELAAVGAPVRTPFADLVRAAVAALGAGLPGRPRGLGAAEIAHRVAALRLAEAVNPRNSPGDPAVGPQRVGLLVQSWTRRLIVESPSAEVLAWLSVDVDG